MIPCQSMDVINANDIETISSSTSFSSAAEAATTDNTYAPTYSLAYSISLWDSPNTSNNHLLHHNCCHFLNPHRHQYYSRIIFPTHLPCSDNPRSHNNHLHTHPCPHNDWTFLSQSRQSLQSTKIPVIIRFVHQTCCRIDGGGRWLGKVAEIAKEKKCECMEKIFYSTQGKLYLSGAWWRKMVNCSMDINF